MGERARGGSALLKLGRKKEVKEKEKEKEKAPTVWLSLKRSLHCKSEPSEVHEPKSRGHIDSILNRKPCRSGCSRSIANLKDVIHGSKRHLERPPSCSPRSIGSSEFLNPITHEVILSNSKCELRITGFNGGHDGDAGLGSTFEGTLRPGTPGPGGHLGARCNSSSSSFRGAGGLTPPRRSPTVMVSERDGHGFGGSNGSVFENNGGDGGRVHLAGSGHRAFVESAAAFVACHKCREQFLKWESLEAHHLSKHAGTNAETWIFSFTISVDWSTVVLKRLP